MKVKVRYYSRSGNTKILADKIAEAAKVKAVSIDDQKSIINEETDILFIGGALYAYGIDKKLKEFIALLDSNKIKLAVVFSTSSISKHSISLIKKALIKKNINILDDYIYYKNKPTSDELKEAEEIVKKIINE